MVYREFKRRVQGRGWTVRQLRSDDAPPDADLMEFIEEVGAGYERHVLRLQAEMENAATGEGPMGAGPW